MWIASLSLGEWILLGIQAHIANALLCGWLASRIAYLKGHSSASWFVLGVSFGEMAILAAIVIQEKPRDITLVNFTRRR